MKKSLLAFCFVTMTFGAFAGEISNVSSSGEVQVTASVIKKLDVETENIEFGKVVQGSSDNKPHKTGKVKINGESKEKIIVKFASNNDGNWTENASDLKVKLTNKENSGSELIYVPSIVTSGKNLSDGEATIELGGKLTVPEEAVVGNYTGILKVKVCYDDDRI